MGLIILTQSKHYFPLQLTLLIFKNTHQHVHITFWHSRFIPLAELALVVLIKEYRLKINDWVFDCKLTIVKDLIIFCQWSFKWKVFIHLFIKFKILKIFKSDLIFLTLFDEINSLTIEDSPSLFLFCIEIKRIHQYSIP